MEALGAHAFNNLSGKSQGDLPQSKMLLDILKKLYKKNVELVKENHILNQQLDTVRKSKVKLEGDLKQLQAKAKLDSKPALKNSLSKLKSGATLRESTKNNRTHGRKEDKMEEQAPNPQQIGTQINARKLMKELNFRLSEEQKQREVETAIYNAQLYEYEKKEIDWFVERKYLEQKITALEEEAEKRNALDEQIEDCIQLLSNKVITAQKS